MENRLYAVNDKKFLFAEIDDEAVLFDVETKEYLNLNSTFYIIFKHLRDQNNLLEIKSFLMNEYAVSEKECEEDLLEAVELMKGKGLIYEKISI